MKNTRNHNQEAADGQPAPGAWPDRKGRDQLLQSRRDTCREKHQTSKKSDSSLLVSFGTRAVGLTGGHGAATAVSESGSSGGGGLFGFGGWTRGSSCV